MPHLLARCAVCGAIAYHGSPPEAHVAAWERWAREDARPLRIERYAGDWRALEVRECGCRRQPKLMEV